MDARLYRVWFSSLLACLPLPIGALAFAVMLAQWSGQERRVSSAVHRRFLAVTGVGHAAVHAIVIHHFAEPQYLSLLILNARPDVGHRDLGPLAIGATDAVASSTALPDDLHLPADIASRAAACQAVAFIQLVQPAQLIAVGFLNPQLRDHSLSGSILSLQLHFPEPQRIAFHQQFSFDGSGSAAQDRIIISPADDISPDQRASWPSHVALLDVMQARDELALAAEPDAVVGAADAAAAAEVVPVDIEEDGAAEVVLEQNVDAAPAGAIVLAGPPPPDHPGPAPFIPAAGVDAADAAANADAGIVALQALVRSQAQALRDAGVQMPDQRGAGVAAPAAAFQQAPAGQIPPPQAFGAPPHVHWADGVGPAPPAPPPGAPPVPPAAPRAPARPASGIPLQQAVGVAAGRIDMSAVPHCVRLFAQCLPHEMVHVPSLDDLARIFSPSGQSPPAGAFLPAGDPMARLEYVEDRLSSILPHTTMPAIRVNSGWPGVYHAARALSRVVVPSASASADLSSSFGRSAERHLSAQLNVQAAPFVPPSSAAVQQLDPQHAAAIRAAGVAVDQECAMLLLPPSC